MSDTRVENALARLEQHHQLHLPLRRTDLLGRLALRFLWRRQLKWQIESNLAIRDALQAIAEFNRAQQARLDEVGGLSAQAMSAQLAHEVNALRESDQNLTAGLNQRLYSSIGRVQSQLSDLRLRQAEAVETAAETKQRIKTVEAQVATLGSAERNVRLRHAQLDVFLDELRAARPEKPATGATPSVEGRDSFLELAVSELLDGPPEHVRAARQAYLPAVTDGVPGPVFDMAPGRGEWLELLRTAGMPFRATSGNSFVRRHCAELGFELDDADPLDTLASTAQRSLGAVTAFRYAERLAPVDLARFVDLAATTLRPGGVLVIETPAAGTADFHLDPFALRPVHPLFLRFLAEAAGFAGVDVQSVASSLESDERYCLIARR